MRINVYIVTRLTVILLMVFTPTARALTNDQIDVLNSGVYYFNTESDDQSATACDGASLSGVTSGTGSPSGALFPSLDPAAMANAINTWIVKEKPSSTLAGLGATIVASAKQANTSPFLIVAIASEESSLGDPNDFNVKNANNAFGRTATESQPHFQGSHLWYKWSSVKASVDYTAAENQGVTGGGDEPAYIRAQYSSLLDSSKDLVDFFTKYAPATDGNDPVAYAAKVRGWINEMVQLAGGQPSDTSGGQTTSACGAGIFSGDIVKTAMGLAWPSGEHGPDKADATVAYQTALPSYNSATNDYSDCGGFVATVMHASGADKSYVGVYVPSQYDYVSKTASAKYKIIKGVQDTSQLQAGDILMYINPGNESDSHTFIYVGKQLNFNGDGAGASLGGHVPEAVTAAASFSYNGRAASGNYYAVRLVQ